MSAPAVAHTDTRLAVLGGAPRFPAGLSLVRPLVPDPDRVGAAIAEVLRGGRLTNGAHVAELERRVAAACEVRNAVAVSSCTAGLMLVYRCLNLHGPVVMPSFTFAASAHAVTWAGSRPRWADIEPGTLNLDPAAVATGLDGAGAVSGTHLYGNPCDVEALEQLTSAAGVPLVLDAAHALGATRRGRPVGGGGTAEVFSLSPTKVAPAGEGGLVTTDDDDLAAALRIGRDYGNPGDYDCRFVGLNARMSELHAVVALASLAVLPERLERRRELVHRFHDRIADLPGVRVVLCEDSDESTYKDLTVVADPIVVGLTVPELSRTLAAEGIDTRRYFHPPCHLQQAYRGIPDADLPVTDRLASAVLSLPLHALTTDAEIDAVADCLWTATLQAPRVRTALSRRT